MNLSAWTTCECGCGYYRNAETGLIRKFEHRAPQRGKWKFYKAIRRPLGANIHVSIYQERRRALEDEQS